MGVFDKFLDIMKLNDDYDDDFYDDEFYDDEYEEERPHKPLFGGLKKSSRDDYDDHHLL